MAHTALASLSIDLDNKWSYLKTHGDSNWDSFPSYFDVVIPRMLDFFDEHRMKATVFVVGQDAEIESNHVSLRSIADAGHEIGNHSFHHEPWLHLYTPNELETELSRAESAIKLATGRHPIGFRGPGFSLTNELLKVLMRRGYQYDGTTFPTYIGPVARMYYFLTSNLSRDQKEERKELFGSWKQGFQSNRPFYWTCGNHRLLEIPVTTMPLFKMPIHASYLMYLAQFSKLAARMYFRLAIELCRVAGIEPSFLLHPLDFLGQEDEPQLAFFPGMKQPAAKKIAVLGDCMQMLGNRFRIVTMADHATELGSGNLTTRSVDSATHGIQEKVVGAE